MSGQPDDARSQHRQTILWCALVFAAALLVRLIFLEAPCFTDDTHYLKISAEYSPELLASARSQVFFRLGMLAPLMALEGTFGYSVFAYYFFAIGAYLLMLWAVYLAARATCGTTTALIAVGLMSTSALVLTRSSNVFPDVPNLALLLFSFVLFRRAVHSDSTSRWPLVAAAACGFAAYLFRVPNTVWLGCLPLYELCERRSLKKSLHYGYIFTALFAVECGYYAILLGEPLARFNIIRHGVAGWSIYMPVISLTQYLLDPIKAFLASWTGVLLLSGGLAGIALAWRRRNWGFVCLAVGSTLLFLAYSYTVTSFQPLQRALPLQVRYIVAFYAVLAMGTAYLLSQFLQGKVVSRWPILVRGAAICGVLTIVGLQTMELPRTIGRRGVFFGNDRFYVADRVYRDLQFGLELEDPVYAAPLQAFQLYPAFGTIQTQPFTLEKDPPAGTTVLFSRRFLQSKVARAERVVEHYQQPALIRRIETLKYFLAPHEEWEYLMDTGDIVLARVNPPADESLAALDLVDSQFDTETWVAAADDQAATTERIIHNENCLTFHIPGKSTTPQSFYTFPGPWSKPVEGWDDVFPRLCREDKVGCAATYELSDDVTQLALTFTEYDARKSLGLKTCFLPTQKGLHRIDEWMALDDRTQSFRVAIRVFGENNTVLRFHQFDVGPVPLERNNPSLAKTPAAHDARLAVREQDHATQ